MSWLLYIIAIGGLIFFAYYGYKQEKKMYCGGTCSKCGHKLKCVEKDSQGCRHYFCEVCGHDVWVTWNQIDKNYDNTENENESREGLDT